MGHWSQYRRRGGGGQPAISRAPPPTTAFAIEFGTPPDLNISATGPAPPGTGFQMDFQLYAVNTPTTFIHIAGGTPIDTGDDTLAPGLSAGVLYAVRARWWDPVSDVAVSGWSAELRATFV